MRIGSLFTGVGGLDLAVEALTGGRVVWCSEIDPYAAHVIKERWPGVPNLGDVTKIKNPAKVDVLCGGFPCQDISLAGQGRGLNGERSGLWREFDRLIGEVEPRVVFVENVAALRKRGLDEVLGNLAERRFNAEWTTLGAVNVGAPHRRARLFLLAYRDRVALRVITKRVRDGGPQPGVCRGAYGVADGLDARRRRGRLRCIGNAVAPPASSSGFFSASAQGCGWF
jgi:DNA (cytosine-5)-methyltransferase 1